MRQLGWLGAGVILGAILGGIPPRRELARSETALRETRRKVSNAAPATRDPGFLPFHLAKPAPAPDPEKKAKDTGAKSTEVPPALEAPPTPPDPAERRRQFELAVDAQRVRIAQNRAALVEEAGLDEAGQARFDGIVADLNADLVEYSDEFIDMALDQEDVSSADMLGVTHDVTGVLHDSQVQLDELLGSSAPPTDESRQVWNYIDLETFRPAMEELDAQGEPPSAP